MRVSLFVTCLVDQFFPQVGHSMVRVLERLGVDVEFNPEQTCCGQPLFNSGYRRDAQSLAERFVRLFENGDYIVAPSGSCTSMVRVFYPDLFSDEAEAARARSLAKKVYEFSEFLVNVLGCEDVGARYAARAGYHPSCHLLRELHIREEPLRLLRHVRELELVELDTRETCCGFGGTFAINFSELSSAILQDKVENIVRSGAQVVVANDSGCLMQISGALRRQRIPVSTIHLAELLACE